MKETIKSISPNKSDDLNQETFHCNSKNGFRHEFGDVGKRRFHPFSLQGNQLFLTRFMWISGIVFSSRPQANAIISKPIFQVIIGIFLYSL